MTTAKNWDPMQVVLSMGEYNGLHKRFNGVSDACLLVDARKGRIFVFGCWMHGLLDTEKSLRDTHYTEHWKQEQEYQVLRTGVPGTTAKASGS